MKELKLTDFVNHPLFHFLREEELHWEVTMQCQEVGEGQFLEVVSNMVVPYRYCKVSIWKGTR